MLKVYVHSRRGLDIGEHRELYAKGRATDPAPYGFDLAENHPGLALTYSHSEPANRLSRFLFRKLRFDFSHAFSNISQIRKADIIWTMLEWEWMAIAVMQILRLVPKTPMVANTVWLSDNWLKYGLLRRSFYRFLMMKHFDFTLHSRRALDLFATHLPDVPFRLSPFGISNRAFPITPPILVSWKNRPIRLYSIGDDIRRDWDIILRAFGNDPRFDVTVACRKMSDEDLRPYKNIHKQVSEEIAQQRKNYLDCDIVVVAMKQNQYSGITVALEAAAMGKPVVCSDTGGVDTYLNGDEVFYVTPEDETALRDIILKHTEEEFYQKALKAQARFMAGEYSAQSMIDRYIAATEKLMSSQQKRKP